MTWSDAFSVDAQEIEVSLSLDQETENKTTDKERSTMRHHDETS